jgi:glutathione S-transferase
MSITVYGIAASRASRPLWLLEELGVPYTHVRTDYRTGEPRLPEFLAINPNGHIPALRDEDTIVWESMACTLYLARKFASHAGLNFGAQTLAEEAQLLRWTFWTVTEVEKDALTVLMHRMVMPADRRDAQLAEQAEKRLLVPLRVLNAHLEQQAYVAADRFTVADINVASVVTWVRPTPALLEAVPAVNNWLANCLARPAQKRVREMASADSRKS